MRLSFRRTVLASATSLILIAVLAMAVAGHAQAFSLREEIATRLERMLSSETISVQGLSIGDDLGLRIRSLALTDSQGSWLIARDIAANWSPMVLFRGRLEINTLTAGSVTVLRSPLREATSGPATPGDGSFLPRLPVAIKIDRFAMPIRLEANFAGQDLSITAEGSAELGGAGLLLRLDAATEAPDSSRLAAIIRHDPERAEFELSATFDEPSGGRVARMLGLPERSPAAFRIEGGGPPENWMGDLQAQVGGKTCVASRLGLNLPARSLRVSGYGFASCVRPDLPVLTILGRVDFDLGLELPATDRLRIATADVNGRFGRLAVSGTVEQKRLDLRYALAGFELSLLSSFGIDAAGLVKAKGGVRGSLGNPQMVTRLDVGRGAASEVRWQGLTADVTVTGLATGQIELSGNGRLTAPVYPGVPSLPTIAWRIGGAISLEGGRVEVNTLTVTTPGYAASVQGWVEQWGRRSALTLDAQVADLGVLANGSGLAGAISLRSQISGNLLDRDFMVRATAETSALRTGVGQLDQILGPAARLSASIMGRGTNIVLQDARLQGADASFEIAGSVLPAALDWRLRVSSLASVGLTGRAEAEGRIEGDIRKPKIPLSVRLDTEQVSASADAIVEMEGASSVVRVSRLVASRGADDIRLAAPARIDVGSETRLGPATFLVRTGSVTVTGGIDAGRALSGSIVLKELPLSLVDLVGLDLGLTGRLNGEIFLGGHLEQPEARLRMRAEGVGASAAPERLRANLVAEGLWRDDVLSIDLQAEARGDITANASARLPLATSGVPENAMVEAALIVQGDVARLAELVPALAARRLEGRLSLRANASGPLPSPLLEGRLLLEDGLFESYDTGTLVREMAIEAELRPDRTVSVAGRARDGERGRVVIQGSGNWTDRPTLEVTTRFVDFQAVRLDAANATVQGAVTLSGNPDRLRLGGDLRVEEVSVDISEFLGPKVVDLPVIEVGEPTNPTNQVPSPADRGEPADRSGPVVDLDLGIEIQRATIRGQGLESDWQGRVAVRGTLSEPRLEGPMEVMRGTYSILGKQFTLAEDSRIVFEGRSPPDPRLAVTASLRAEDLTAKVSLSGLAGSPKIDLSSEPLVPKDEILARILFGRKLGTLSTVQQLQLAQAAAELAFGGAGVGFDPVGKVRDFLGFDTLSVGGDAKGPGGGRMVNSSGLATSSGAGNGSAPSGGFAPSVSAGKYLDQDTFLQVGRGEEGGTVSVERQLGGGFSVETEVGARTGGGVSLRWTKDY